MGAIYQQFAFQSGFNSNICEQVGTQIGHLQSFYFDFGKNTVVIF